ncbi:MAG: zeta toxin family protein [Ruminococcus sp.]|nr:zeta toxin family protein [Ruminococcus sp.]
MKKYTVIGGVNGVGKSSLTGVLKGELNDMGVIVNTDILTAKFGGDKIKGGKAAVKIISDCLDKGVNFTQETTLSWKKTLRTIISARRKDYYIRLYYVGVNSAEESIARITCRVKKGGHSIPTEDVIRRHEKRFESLAAVISYCDEVRFYDNENGLVRAGEYRNGELVLNAGYCPQWLREFNEYLNG